MYNYIYNGSCGYTAKLLHCDPEPLLYRDWFCCSGGPWIGASCYEPGPRRQRPRSVRHIIRCAAGLLRDSPLG